MQSPECGSRREIRSPPCEQWTSWVKLPLTVWVQGRKSEVRSQNSEVRSQKSEVRSQKSEVRSQKSEVRSQKSEVRSQKSEVRSQKVRVGGIPTALVGDRIIFRPLLAACSSYPLSAHIRHPHT